MSASLASSETAALLTGAPNASLGKRRTGQTVSQPSGGLRSSLHLSEGRPNSTGVVQQAHSRGPSGLSIDTHDEDEVPLRATQSSQSGHARESPLRASKDGRPASRPNAALQSPYLQPPGGRLSQSSGHRPASRPQSQQSPPPHHQSQQALAGQPPTPTPATPASAASATGTPSSASSSPSSSNPLRRSTNTSSGAGGSANGARIFQAYGAPPPPPPRPLHSVASAPAGAPQPSPKPAQSQAGNAVHGRPNDPFTLQHPHQHQQQQHQQHQQQQQARAVVAQQQQQQAGPRATTALSGARSMQRGTGSGALAGGVDAPGGPHPLAAPQQAAGFRPPPAAAPGSGSVLGGPHPHPYPYPPGGGGGHLGSGPGGMALYPDPGVSTSFGYDDIPEEDDESLSPANSNSHPFSGLTLDQYMQRMVTTPASAAATSGLGVSADSGEESAPCSPGNASTRTEEDDSPHSSPFAMPPAAAATTTTSPSLGRQQQQQYQFGDGERGRDAAAAAAARRGPGVLAGPSPPAGGGGGGMPRFGAGPPRAAAPAAAARISITSSGSGGGTGGGLLQRMGSGCGTASSGGGAATAVRISLTNPPAPPPGRGSTGLGGPPPARAGGGGGAAAAYMYDDVYGGSGSAGGADVSAMLDGGSSDDDQLNPSALLNDSPRSSRRLSSRASAMAFSNSLDLRPATAAVLSSSSMGRGDPNTPRNIAMATDTGNHHAIIKQVDLGGLSASLFTPNNPNSGRETSGSPASTANNLAAGSADYLTSSNSSSPELACGVPAGGRPDRRIAAGCGSSGGGGSGTMLRPTGPSSGDHAHVSAAGGGGPGVKALISPKTSMGAIPPPWGVSAREGAFGGGPAGDGAGGAGSLQALAARPLSSRGRPGAVAAAGGGGGGGGSGGDMVVVSPGAATAAGTAAAAWPGSGAKWAKPQQQPQQQQHAKSDAGAGPPVPMDLPPEARLLAAEAQGVPRPPTRQVQSARPPGCRGEVELDPSVWQANIAMQLQQRPPSRQKPPPEALHLWTPEQQMGMLASGAGLGRAGPGGGGRPLGGRPQSAAPTTYRGGSRPTSGPSVKAHGPVGEDVAGTSARPPSRQKPPPLSTLLEHDDFPPPPAGSRRQRPGADTMDVVMSCSEEGDDDDDDDDLGL
ncbi:hypothetical protein PLESTM_001651100 [Pleodorina starrii]|nr:hypothetical protein PLESTM_001651100 [Pleodorina starrii]